MKWIKLYLIITSIDLARVLGDVGDVDNPALVSARIDSRVWLPCPLQTAGRRTVEWSATADILIYVGSTGNVLYQNIYSNNTHIFQYGNHSLSILRASTADGIRHKCTVNYDDGWVSDYYSMPVLYAPPTSVTLSHSILEVDENTQANVTCFVASVYPSNTLQMYIKLGETRVCTAPVSYNNNSNGTKRAQGLCTLRFNRTANGQTAKCEVEFQYNGVDRTTISSSVIRVAVRYCDTISLTLNSSPNVNENTPVSLTCRTQCYPHPNMSLVIENSILNSAVAETIQYTHLVQRENHRKSFKCKIREVSRLDSNLVYFSVTFNARHVILTTSSTGYIDAGSSVTLTCITDEAFPTATVTWSWSGPGAVPGNVTYTEEAGTCCDSAKRRKSERVIVAVNKTYNSKIIFCNSSSLTNSTTLNVKFPPSTATIANLTSVAVVEGSPLSFICTTDLFNPSTSLTNLTWKIGSSPLDNATMPEFVSASSGYGGYTGSSTVSFTAMRGHDQEAVSCTPKWAGTNISGFPQPVTVTVYYLPQINVSVNDSGLVDEDSICVIMCFINGGNPTNVASYSFTWFWSANPGGLETNLQQNRQTLTYNAVTYQQSGLYRCKATSVAGTTEAAANLSVRYAPIGLNVNEANKKIINANLSTSTVLDLKVHSFPTGNDVIFSWIKGGTQKPSQKRDLTNNETISTVNISSVSEDDFGNYTIVVTNGGSRRSTFYIELKLQGSNGGVIAGSVVSVILIVVLASVGLLYWRKVRNQRRQNSNANVYTTTTNSTEVDNAAHVYDEIKLNQENKGEYTSLTPLRSAAVYENFVFSKNSKTDIIHSGHFLTYQCQLQNGLCAVKTLKGDASYIHEAKWILAQTAAMKNLPLHRTIAEIVACNSDIETPLLLTKLAVKGDLKSTLTSSDRNAAGIIVSLRNALDIAEGMNFLSKYQLLHYELSTSHVLLGQNDECKIINFASAESVRDRQKSSLKLNDLSCVPWLAPECLLSAEQHCTASDVWSFGVLLYEIITSGATPYKDMSSEEIGEFVLQGKTLKIPIEGKRFGEIITRCWNFEPADRPDWTQLKEMLFVLHAQFAASAGVYEIVRFEEL